MRFLVPALLLLASCAPAVNPYPQLFLGRTVPCQYDPYVRREAYVPVTELPFAEYHELHVVWGPFARSTGLDADGNYVAERDETPAATEPAARPEPVHDDPTEIPWRPFSYGYGQ